MFDQLKQLIRTNPVAALTGLSVSSTDFIALAERLQREASKADPIGRAATTQCEATDLLFLRRTMATNPVGVMFALGLSSQDIDGLARSLVMYAAPSPRPAAVYTPPPPRLPVADEPPEPAPQPTANWWCATWVNASTDGMCDREIAGCESFRSEHPYELAPCTGQKKAAVVHAFNVMKDAEVFWANSTMEGCKALRATIAKRTDDYKRLSVCKPEE